MEGSFRLDALVNSPKYISQKVVKPFTCVQKAKGFCPIFIEVFVMHFVYPYNFLHVPATKFPFVLVSTVYNNIMKNEIGQAVKGNAESYVEIEP